MYSEVWLNCSQVERSRITTRTVWFSLSLKRKIQRADWIRMTQEFLRNRSINRVWKTLLICIESSFPLVHTIIMICSKRKVMRWTCPTFNRVVTQILTKLTSKKEGLTAQKLDQNCMIPNLAELLILPHLTTEAFKWILYSLSTILCRCMIEKTNPLAKKTMRWIPVLKKVHLSLQ